MRQPPRDPREPILPWPFVRRVVLESAAIAAGSLAAYVASAARNGFGPLAQTTAFASLLGAQLLHVPLARAGDRPATRERRPRNRALLLGIGVSAALQLAGLFFPPLRVLLGGAVLGPLDLATAALGALVPIAAIELARLFSARAPLSRIPTPVLAPSPAA